MARKMIATLRFVEMVTAIIALIGRMRDLNTELVKQLALMRRARPRSEIARPPRATARATARWPHRARRQAPDATSFGRREEEEPRGAIRARSAPPAHLAARARVQSRSARAARLSAVRRDDDHGQPLELFNSQRHPRARRRRGTPRRDHRVPQRRHDRLGLPAAAIVERGKLADTLIVEAVCDKFIEHLPIERQCTRFARAGVDVAPHTLGRSVGAAIDLLAPVARLIEEQTRAPGLLGTDATGIPVLDPAAPEGIRYGTIWAGPTPAGSRSSTRRRVTPRASDDFSDMTSPALCNAMARASRAFWNAPAESVQDVGAHARRRLVEAARAGDRVALEGVRIIARLFAVERDSTSAGDNAEQRRDRRQRLSRPILDELRSWMKQHKSVVPPKTPLGKGLGYLDRQWRRLLLFLDDGNIEATSRVGGRRGGVQAALGCVRRFRLRARVGFAIAPSPAPATSNRTGGFPASGSPRGCHHIGVMRPSRLALLSPDGDSGSGSHRRDPRCRTPSRYSTSTSRSPFASTSSPQTA